MSENLWQEWNEYANEKKARGQDTDDLFCQIRRTSERQYYVLLYKPDVGIQLGYGGPIDQLG